MRSGKGVKSDSSVSSNIRFSSGDPIGQYAVCERQRDTPLVRARILEPLKGGSSFPKLAHLDSVHAVIP